ncbi:Major facilitator superfamily domain-containing protein 1 [Leucoagaricus sp. SymC.cos]|nr:Major facilitator superfamily domain-containing protein 1 [Leucoagaricus sp. SymC.cos]
MSRPTTSPAPTTGERDGSHVYDETVLLLQERASNGAQPSSNSTNLSVGVHYASYILGPLKSRIQRELGTSHAEFGVLFSAYGLNSTWTPLVAGLLVSRLGTTFTSILATGTIFLGQVILLIGERVGSIRLMALGLFTFGFGATPLAVVQETIVVRFFKSHGLGVSMAFGLIAGKASSFVAARTSYPLMEHFGSSAPFYVAAFLTGFSFAINLVYITCSRWLVDGAGAELEAPDLIHDARHTAPTDLARAQVLTEIAEKRKVRLAEIAKLGDLFWVYILLNIWCGMIWSPFSQLAANIIEKRYKLTEEEAATKASYLLAGSMILYPIVRYAKGCNLSTVLMRKTKCGLVVDRHNNKPIATNLLMLSSLLTGFTYTWLVIAPVWTSTPTPGIISFALGYGFAPLLLVVIVPKVVDHKYVSTALGAHKSVEQTGTILFQTLAGLSLDITSKGGSNAASVQRLLNTFLFLNALHMLSIFLLAHLQSLRTNSKARAQERAQSSTQGSQDTSSQEQTSLNEVRRGKIFTTLAATLVVTAWILFLGTAYYRLGRKSVLSN